MNIQTFNKNTKFESDTYYSFDKIDCDIYMKDTERLCKKKYLVIAESNHGYLDVAFYLKGLKNVTLDFGGAMLVCHGRIQPFIIDECENITIKNVTVAYERAFYSEFDVISNNGKELTLARKEKFPCRVENNELIPYGENWEDRDLSKKCMFLQAYDKKTREGRGLWVVMIGENPVELETPPCAVAELTVREEGNNIVLSGDNIPSAYDNSTMVVLEHESRDKSSVAMYHSKNINIENYRVLNGTGMGLLAIYTENITAEKYCLINDSLSHGIVANGGDGIHLVNCKGKITLNNCIVEGTVDDALNIHGNFYHTVKADGNLLYAERSAVAHYLDANSDIFAEGDEIAVYKGKTMEEKIRFTVKSVKILDDYNIVIETDKNAEEAVCDDVIENLSTNPDFEFKNCIFGKANSHLRLQSRGKGVVENCECELPIMLTGDLNYWFESSPVKDLTVKNCKFFGERGFFRLIPECNPTEKEPYYHSGVKITDCIFEREIAIEGRDTKDIEFINNCHSEGKTLKLKLENCSNVKTDCADIV